MRNISQTTTDREITSSLAPIHSITSEIDMLSFNSAETNPTQSWLTLSIPVSVVQDTDGGDRAYAVVHSGTGTHTVWTGLLSTQNQWTFSGGGTLFTNPGGSTSGTLRSGIFRESNGNVYAFTAISSGGGIQVRRAYLSGQTSNPLTVSLSNYGPVFGPALSVGTYNAATLVTRVEAVFPYNGGCIVLVGRHEFSSKRSTISVWDVTTSSARRLDTFIQADLLDGYNTWFNFSNHWCYGGAIYDPVTDEVLVVMNSSPTGRAVQFTIKDGVESHLEPVVYFDIETKKSSLVVYNLQRIFGRVYATARLEKDNSDDTTLGIDCYITTSDNRFWTFGERSFYITTSDAKGSILLHSSAYRVYYIGHSYRQYSAASVEQSPSNPGAILDLTSRMMSWELSQITNGADTLSLELNNADSALVPEARFRGGTVVKLRSGQGAALDDIGRYSLDGIEYRVSTQGNRPVSVSARDVAGKRLSDWHTPMDIWLAGQSHEYYDLDADDDLMEKTRFSADRKFIKGMGMLYNGLNTPSFYLYDAPAGDCITKVRVRFNVDDGYHHSFIGFIVNGREDKDGNFSGMVVFVPKTRGESLGWTGDFTGLDRPTARLLNLVPIDVNDKDKAGTGFNFIYRDTILWKTSETKDKLTSDASGTYTYNPAFSVPANTDYDIAVKTIGRKIQVYAKQVSQSAATWSQYAGWTLVMEFLADETLPVFPSQKTYSGLIVETDTWGNTQAFGESEYNPIESGLSEAENYATNADFGQYTGTAQYIGGNQLDFINVTRTPNQGQYVRLYRVGEVNFVTKITGFSGNRWNISYTTGVVPTNVDLQVLWLNPDDVWGMCGSSSRQYTDSLGKTRILSIATKKKGKVMGGRAAIITSDNTAVSVRMIESDGVTHLLHTGSVYGAPDGTGLGFDVTNPLEKNTIGDFNETDYGSSSPQAWRIIFHPNRIMNKGASALGLPVPAGTNGSRNRYCIIEDEIVRYLQYDLLNRGQTTTKQWICIPTYYAPLQSTQANSTIIKQWWNGNKSPGDIFSEIPNIAGMLVEVTGRDATIVEDEKDTVFYRAVSATARNGTTVLNEYITLDKPYPNPIRHTVTKDTDLIIHDAAVISGRAQLGTKKERHGAGLPVVYYPCDSNGNRATINVASIDYLQGRQKTVQDTLKQIATMSGVKSVVFKNMAGTDGYLPYAINLTSAPQVISTSGPLGDFVMEMNVMLPGNNLSGGAVSSDNYIAIDFRGKYRLRISQYNDQGSFQGSRWGNVRVSLDMLTTELTAYNGYRTIESVVVPVTPLGLNGGVSGSGGNWTTGNDVSITQNLYVSAQGGMIYVEINGHQVWYINLDNMFADGTIKLKSEDEYSISISTGSTVSNHAASIVIRELGARIGGYAIRQNNSGRAAIDEVIEDRSVYSRATSDGGIEFSQYNTRVLAGTLTANIMSDDYTSADHELVGHFQVTGDNAYGSYLDAATVVANGYRFGASNSQQVKNTADAIREARLRVRRQKEEINSRNVSGFGRIEFQPEDRVNLSYDPGVGLVSHAVSSHVLTEISLSASLSAVKGTYKLRGYET